jgi:predicted TIM-barrel fold metal-dependent hydrolase
MLVTMASGRADAPDSGGPAPGPAFDVLDVHQHYGTVTDAMGGLPVDQRDGPEDDFDRRELSTRLAALDARGVRQTVVIASHAYLRPEGLADTRRVNDGVAAYVARTPERFVAAVGVVEPLYGAAGLAEVDRCRALGMIGISFHGRYQGVSHDSPWVYRFIERMGELGMVPFVHAPAGSPEESLWKAAGLAAAFGDLPMLVLDAFSGFEECREAVAVAAQHPNLVFDTALAFDFAFVLPFVERCGVDRLVYGSDLYSWPSPVFGDAGIDQILASPLDDAAKAAILGGNARRLLGLS